MVISILEFHGCRYPESFGVLSMAVRGALRCLALLSDDLDDTCIPKLVPELFLSLYRIISSPHVSLLLFTPLFFLATIYGDNAICSHPFWKAAVWKFSSFKGSWNSPFVYFHAWINEWCLQGSFIAYAAVFLSFLHIMEYELRWFAGTERDCQFDDFNAWSSCGAILYNFKFTGAIPKSWWLEHADGGMPHTICLVRLKASFIRSCQILCLSDDQVLKCLLQLIQNFPRLPEAKISGKYNTLLALLFLFCLSD